MGLKLGSTFGPYKLVWQAGLICTLVGSPRTIGNDFFAKVRETLASRNLAPALV